jgi:large subunit ribosomal protein L4
MARTTILNATGGDAGSVDLAESLFGAPVNASLIHQAVVRQQAGRRIGTADTLTRAEVRGGGRKPWRQKGTGRSRQGTRNAPQWAGGGVVFGPHPRSYEQRMPAKMRRSALRGALSAKQADGAVRVVTGFELDEIKTRSMLERRSARNLREVRVIMADSLNVVDLLEADTVVFTREALDRAQEVYA